MSLRGELVAVADPARPSVTQGDSTAKVPYQADSAGQWKSGEQIYRSICVPCHETGIGPTIVGLSLPAVVVVTMVRHGLNTMPTFRPSEINDHELQELGEWVQQSKASVNKSVSTAGAP